MREMAARGKSAADSGPFPARSRAFMRAAMASETPLLFVPVGTMPARPFGMDARDRACRLATNAGFECADAPQPGRAALLASMDYAWDPAWLKAMRDAAANGADLGGKPVLAHVPGRTGMPRRSPRPRSGASAEGYETLAAETAELSYTELQEARAAVRAAARSRRPRAGRARRL